MPIDFATQVSVTVNATSALAIDSSLRLTTPANPSFYATSGSGVAAGSQVIPAGIVYNVGNGYNATTGNFTAPVAGVYHFQYHQLLPNATTGRFDVALYKNNGYYGGCRFIMQKDTASVWKTIRVESVIKMAVNDFVNVWYLTGGAALYTDANYGAFSGAFIG